VAAGVTFWVPPVAASVNVLLSVLSVITTCVAFEVVTVRVEALPFVTEVGLAAMLTVGAEAAGAEGSLDEEADPDPQEVTVNKATKPMQMNEADQEKVGDSLGIIGFPSIRSRRLSVYLLL
jgi:hypothetical protein